MDVENFVELTIAKDALANAHGSSEYRNFLRGQVRAALEDIFVESDRQKAHEVEAKAARVEMWSRLTQHANLRGIWVKGQIDYIEKQIRVPVDEVDQLQLSRTLDLLEDKVVSFRKFISIAREKVSND